MSEQEPGRSSIYEINLELKAAPVVRALKDGLHLAVSETTPVAGNEVEGGSGLPGTLQA